MDGWDLVYPLPRIAAVVYSLGVSVLLQSAIADFSPCAAPFLCFCLFVPVCGGNGFAFIGTLFRVIDFVAVPVKNILFFLLRSPCAVLLDGAYCQNDMGVGIAVLFVVYADNTQKDVNAYLYVRKYRDKEFSNAFFLLKEALHCRTGL